MTQKPSYGRLNLTSVTGPGLRPGPGSFSAGPKGKYSPWRKSLRVRPPPLGQNLPLLPYQCIYLEIAIPLILHHTSNTQYIHAVSSTR